MPDYDIVIRGGTIVDGTGMPRYRGDVGIRSGRVAALGRVDGDAARVLDATGRIVAPGIVDLHTHYDAQLNWDPYATNSGWNGVTTVMIGMCGFGFAPIRPQDRDRAMLLMSRVEAIPLTSMRLGMRWDWVSLGEYLDSLQRAGVGINVGSMVPHSPLRSWVIGLDAAKDRAATADEVGRMADVLRAGIRAGGFGFSTDRNIADTDYDGSPLPSHRADDTELLALCGVLREFGIGSIEYTLAAHRRPDFKFTAALSRAAGRPIVWNALAQFQSQPDHWRRVLSWMDELNRDSQLYGMTVCFPTHLYFTLEEMNQFDDMPHWREVLSSPMAQRKKLLSDPAVRAALNEDFRTVRTRVFSGEWQDISVTHTRPDKHAAGCDIQSLADAERRQPIDVFLDLALSEDLKTGFKILDFANRDQEALATMLKHPHAVVGLSDGGAHTKLFSLGKYPVEFLGHWIRDRQLMSLEEAHWRLSFMPAWIIGLHDRGVLREGMAADIIVYDLEGLRIEPAEPEMAYDLPGGEGRLLQRAVGIDYTIVNGQITFEGQTCTGARPGAVLRSPAYDPKAP
ncbi:MAG TPA: amidohydrolase family protein [Candidatus Binataceae bacterium]|nr:amidohydrolase family protein [Candidatus Binataceae bacterium]